jgi:hypothetical protein
LPPIWRLDCASGFLICGIPLTSSSNAKESSIYGTGGIIPTIAGELSSRYDALGVPYGKIRFKAVGAAIKILYGLQEASEKTLSKAGYHNSLMCQQNRKLVKEEAIKWCYREMERSSAAIMGDGNAAASPAAPVDNHLRFQALD